MAAFPFLFLYAAHISVHSALSILYSATLAREGRFMSLVDIRQDWFSNVRNDLLAGLVVALHLFRKRSLFPSLPA